MKLEDKKGSLYDTGPAILCSQAEVILLRAKFRCNEVLKYNVTYKGQSDQTVEYGSFSGFVV
jgi:hypothetical protein